MLSEVVAGSQRCHGGKWDIDSEIAFPSGAIVLYSHVVGIRQVYVGYPLRDALRLFRAQLKAISDDSCLSDD